MTRIRSRPFLAAFSAMTLIAIAVVLGFAVYAANIAGDLPWQVDPTLIPVTPFADIPGFSAPTPLPTAAP